LHIDRGQAAQSNVLLELAGRDGNVKLPLMSFLESLLNTTSGFGISLVAQWLPFFVSLSFRAIG
jgi:hypothetical protein